MNKQLKTIIRAAKARKAGNFGQIGSRLNSARGEINFLNYHLALNELRDYIKENHPDLVGDANGLIGEMNRIYDDETNLWRKVKELVKRIV